MIYAQSERLQLAVINSENANNKLSYYSGSEGSTPHYIITTSYQLYFLSLFPHFATILWYQLKYYAERPLLIE